MKNQFFNGVKISSFIDALKPKRILELGCGACENVIILLSYTYKDGNDYKVIGISDDDILLALPLNLMEKFAYVKGITYNRLPTIQETLPEHFKGKFDLVIVDSDHNYFTVQKELETVYPHLSEKCVIAFHDTISYDEAGLTEMRFLNINPKSNSTYEVQGYRNGEAYPFTEIYNTLDKPITLAIEEFITEHPEFKILRKTLDHCGCWVIGRGIEC